MVHRMNITKTLFPPRTPIRNASSPEQLPKSSVLEVPALNLFNSGAPIHDLLEVLVFQALPKQLCPDLVALAEEMFVCRRPRTVRIETHVVREDGAAVARVVAWSDVCEVL